MWSEAGEAVMQKLVRLAGAICTVAFLGGCATGPKYADLKDAIPKLDPSNGRIYFYRNAGFLGMAMQFSIFLNGEVVGYSISGVVFLVDHSPGPIEVEVPSKVETKENFNLEAGQVRYIRTWVDMGGVHLELVDPEVARKDIASLSYSSTQVTVERPLYAPERPKATPAPDR
jgi:hypothetical protein